MTCPRCSSENVRRSHRHRWRELLVLPLGRRAYRCRACRFRFQVRGGGVLDALKVALRWRPVRSAKRGAKRGQKRLRRWMWEAGVFALMLLLFLAFLRYLVQERTGGSESGRVSVPQLVAQR